MAKSVESTAIIMKWVVYACKLLPFPQISARLEKCVEKRAGLCGDFKMAGLAGKEKRKLKKAAEMTCWNSERESAYEIEFYLNINQRNFNKKATTMFANIKILRRIEKLETTAIISKEEIFKVRGYIIQIIHPRFVAWM
jgi:hypothetical protein